MESPGWGAGQWGAHFLRILLGHLSVSPALCLLVGVVGRVAHPYRALFGSPRWCPGADIHLCWVIALCNPADNGPRRYRQSWSSSSSTGCFWGVVKNGMAPAALQAEWIASWFKIGDLWAKDPENWGVLGLGWPHRR